MTSCSTCDFQYVAGYTECYAIFNKKRSSEKHSDSSDKANSQLLTAMIIMTEYFILADLAPSLAQPCERLPFLRARAAWRVSQ